MEFSIGLSLIIIGGLFEGIFSLGIMRTPDWKWEHTWGLGSLCALILVPIPVALLTVPHLFQVYQNVSAGTISIAVLFGLGWGIGGIFLGLGVSMVGLALGISLIMGLIAVFGSAGPLLLRNPAAFSEPSGLVLISGLTVMIAGVVLCAFAGKKRTEETSGKEETAQRSRKKYFAGITICILSGVLSPLVNYAFIFGDDIRNAAVNLGADPAFAVNAIWVIVFSVNFFTNFVYALYLALRNKSFRLMMEKKRPAYWGWALFLGLTWPLGIILYGIGAAKLGSFGGYAGFPLMLISSIIGSNLAGAAIGEWRGTQDSTKRIMQAGVAILIIAAALFAFSNSLMTV